jgi:hypothetical protein
VRIGIALAVAGIALGTARLARVAAEADRPTEIDEEPYAPSPQAAPFIAMGYREVAADLFWIRLVDYFGGRQSTADGVAALVEAIVALDPRFHRIYDYGANAMTIASFGVTQSSFRRAIAVLERGMREFPDDWKLPMLAGEMYTLDLKTEDAAQRRAWDERGTLDIESAIRKPGAPIGAATYAAHMRTKLGQRQRAIDGLREMLLSAKDADKRKTLAEKLAALEGTDADAINAATLEEKRRFDTAWLGDRPQLPSAMYILLGPHPAPAFDLVDLATGGRDLVGTQEPERLEPLD